MSKLWLLMKDWWLGGALSRSAMETFREDVRDARSVGDGTCLLISAAPLSRTDSDKVEAVIQGGEPPEGFARMVLTKNIRIAPRPTPEQAHKAMAMLGLHYEVHHERA